MKPALLCWIALLTIACDDDEDSDGTRTCGNGSCEMSTCETVVRCPEDCGTCVGTGCDVSGAQGSCNEACSTSCDCANQGELCTADYGELPGRCIPTDCLVCSTFEECTFTPNSDGLCASASCG